MIILDKLLSYIAPFECIICNTEDDLICSSCKKVFSINLPCCFVCRETLPAYSYCPKKHENTPINRLYSVSDYSLVAKQIVLSLKSQGMVGSASLMAKFMSKNLDLNSNAIVTSIPTASSRIRVRGFDQSALLAREIARSIKAPYIKFLLRTNQSRQVGASKKERLQNIETAFRIRNPSIIIGADILLVDDVLTTGASLETAARLLLSQGARSVDAVVFAVA